MLIPFIHSISGATARVSNYEGISGSRIFSQIEPQDFSRKPVSATMLTTGKSTEM